MPEDRIDRANRTWRPFLAWVLGVNIAGVIVNIQVMSWIRPDSPSLPILLQLLFTLLGAALGKSVIRQTGKNKKMDVDENIKIAEIEGDDGL